MGTVFRVNESDCTQPQPRPAILGIATPALLWATADRIGVRYLLTENFHDGRTLGGVTFVDPFTHENERLIAEILPAR